MSRYLLSPKAAADLSDIWDYSARQWGNAQADRYVLAMRDTCKALASAQLPGHDADFIRSGYRRQACGSHVLFYRIAGNGDVEIIRILHQRMDVQVQLRNV